MMKKIEYKLLATDGSWTKEFLFFLQVKHGDIYYGLLDGSGNPGKSSRHVSGHSHAKYNEYTVKLGKGRRLTDYDGLHQLFVLSVGRQVFSSSTFGRSPNPKSIDGSILIDVRRFEQRVGIIAFLLEPGKAETLSRLGRQLKNLQLTIMTKTIPWFVIAIYDAGTGVLKSDDSRMLPWNRTLLKVEVPSSENGGNLILIDGPSEQ